MRRQSAFMGAENFGSSANIQYSLHQIFYVLIFFYV